MDEFDRAEVRAQKTADKRQRYQPLVEKPYGFTDEPPAPVAAVNGTLHLPKSKAPKTPAKRTNEIGITIYVDGQEIHLTARVNLNDIIASQRNRAGLTQLFKGMLAGEFGRVEIT